MDSPQHLESLEEMVKQAQLESNSKKTIEPTPAGNGPMPANTRLLRLDLITKDPETQARVQMIQSYLKSYASLIKEKVEFPPITVFYDGNSYYLADGYYRYHAHEKAGRTEILSEIKNGSKRDAILHAVGANAKHGVHRSNADKRRAVEILLKDDEWKNMSDREIANQCGVSQPFVGSVKKALIKQGYSFPDEVKGKDGVVRNTTNIGKGERKKLKVSVGSPSNENGMGQNDGIGKAVETANPETSLETPVQPIHPAQPDPLEVVKAAPEGQTGDGESVESPEPTDKVVETMTGTEPEVVQIANNQPGGGNDSEPPVNSEPSAATNDPDDVPFLKQRIRDLEATLRAKDAEIQRYKKSISELQDQLDAIMSDKIDFYTEEEPEEIEE